MSINDEFKHITANESSLRVRSAEGLCVGIVDKNSDIEWAASALEKEMSETESFGGIMVFTLKDDFNLVTKELREELADIGISISCFTESEPEVEVDRLIGEFKARQKFITSNYIALNK